MTPHRLSLLVATLACGSFAFVPPTASAGDDTSGAAESDRAKKKGAAATTDAPGTATEAAAAEPKTAERPDGFALLAKYREAGGYAKLRETKNQHVTGTFSMPAQGIEATMDAWVAAPNLIHVIIDIPGIGITQEGFDGTHAWSFDPIQGPHIKSGAAAEEAAFDADYFSDLDEGRYLEAETLEQVDFHGRPAWKVRLKPRVGSDSFVFLDVQNGLEVGEEQTVTTPMGSIPVVVRSLDYKEFNGMQFPTRIEQSTMGMTQIISIVGLEFDVDPAPAFDLPPAVKELLADPETPAAE